MIFTHLARLVAAVTLFLGGFHILLGVAIATEFMGPYEATLARYSGKSSAGQIIDKGIYIAVFAIALGTLAEISFSVRRAFPDGSLRVVARDQKEEV